MAIEYNFTLDMDRSKRDNNIAYARTGDVDSITINADLVLNGAAYTPTGANAFFECITPNGHSIRVAASKTGSTVSVDVPPAAFQAAGVINVAYFRFESGEADNPTYVESTEPFAIVVREGIGDDIDAGDYIEEWRQLADQLEAIVAEVEQKAEQAETAINEQKAEVDQLKAQVQVSMAQDAEDVSDAKDTAISNINGSQGAVDAAIEQLEQKTQEAVDAAQEALDGTLATDLQNKIDRTLKLDIADMVDISSNTSLSSLTAVGSYCCKTAATAATISDSPVDDSPFNMYVFSSSTSGQVMQLVVPIDLNSKPTAEWHVRFGTSSAMDPWSVIGGGADIAAGLGIDVTGDAKKTVALDTDAFYQHHEAAEVIQGSTEVTGGGRIKELTVYGSTRQNLWVNPSGTQNGVTVTTNADGSITLSGTPTSNMWIFVRNIFTLRPGSTYTFSVNDSVSNGNAGFYIEVRASDNSGIVAYYIGAGQGYGGNQTTFTVPSNAASATFGFGVNNASASIEPGTYRVMLNEGSTAQPWCPPGLNGVEELSIVTAGKNLCAMPSITKDGLTLTNNEDGSFSVSGESTSPSAVSYIDIPAYPGATIHVVKDGSLEIEGSPSVVFQVLRGVIGSSGSFTQRRFDAITDTETSYTLDEAENAFRLQLYTNNAGAKVSGTVRLYAGFQPFTEYSAPAPVTAIPIDLDGHALNGLPDGTRDELRVDGTGAVTLVQRVGVATAPTDAGSWSWHTTHERAYFTLPASSSNGSVWDQSDIIRCDKLPVAESISDAAYTLIIAQTAYAKNPAITSTATAATVAGGATYLYPLAEPVEVELPGVSMPDLASPSYIVYASSNVPAEMEAEVVKVDYLPAPDVYTKQEVDQKIEAGSMPDIVPVSKGGTGVTSAAAERNRLGLGNTTGALPVANGGTGAAAAKAAEYNILGGMITDGSDPEDTSNFAMVRGEPSSAGGVLFKRKGTNVWNWIASKIRSVFGFNASNVLTLANGGTSATSSASARSNLNVYSKAEVDGKVPKVVYGTGNIPGSAENGTIYIQYRS